MGQFFSERRSDEEVMFLLTLRVDWRLWLNGPRKGLVDVSKAR